MGLGSRRERFKSPRDDVEDLIDTPGDEVELTISGELTDGSPFEGSDTIRAIEPP